MFISIHLQNVRMYRNGKLTWWVSLNLSLEIWLEKYKKVIDISAYIYYSVFSTGIEHILLINYSFVFLPHPHPDEYDEF